jgi:hypothetical protein
MKLKDFRAQVDLLIADLWKKPGKRRYVTATYNTWKNGGTPMQTAMELAGLKPVADTSVGQKRKTPPREAYQTATATE